MHRREHRGHRSAFGRNTIRQLPQRLPKKLPKKKEGKKGKACDLAIDDTGRKTVQMPH